MDTMTKPSQGNPGGKDVTSNVTIDVDVTPVTAGGQIVLCDLAATPGGSGGTYVTDGVLFLSDGNTYQLNFHLKSGPLGQFTWDNDPFWAKKSKCPDKSGMPNGQFPSAPTVAGLVMSVGANGVPGKSAIHFRLNLKDPANQSVYCDPIIVNN